MSQPSISESISNLYHDEKDNKRSAQSQMQRADAAAFFGPKLPVSVKLPSLSKGFPPAQAKGVPAVDHLIPLLDKKPSDKDLGALVDTTLLQSQSELSLRDNGPVAAKPAPQPLYKMLKDTTSASADDFARHALAVVYKSELDAAEVKQVTQETVRYWNDNVNSGFLKYRKSMAEGDDHACLDWVDHKPGSANFLDAKGREYLDCLGGFGIYNVGRRNPTVVAAVQAQLQKQPLHSQELLDPLRSYAAKLLSQVTPGRGALSHWFFINSGAEAVEAALKMAMLHTGRKHIVATINAFHGKTLGALATTSKSVFRQPFLPSLLNVTHVPFNDINHLRETFKASRFTGNEIGALILEPIQGEGGIFVANNEFLQEARRLCDEYGACLIFDEVQSGMGRSGRWFACEWAGPEVEGQGPGVVPDLICLGKALGGGVMPVAACGGRGKIWSKYIDNPFLLTTTFGGNPLALAAAIATIHVIMRDNLLLAAQQRGEQMMKGLEKLRAEFPEIVGAVRGRGLLIGLEFKDNDYGVVWAKAMFTQRILTSGTLVNSKVVRIEPPLTITAEQVDHVLACAAKALREVRASIAPQIRSKL